MKWPWVARERLAAAERYLDIAHAEIRAERTIAETRYDALLEKYQSLRVAGAVEVPAPDAMTWTKPAVQEHDELRELIGALAGNNLAKRKIMLRQLAADRADKLTDDEIRQRIEQGVSGDGVPA